MKNYSKQRQLILDTLKNKVDHPTAETLYKDVKNQMPEIGIATVYRNLAALCDAGEVVKLKSKAGPDRYDATLIPHVHFECNNCHEIYDIFINDSQTKKIDNEIKRLTENIDSEFESSNIYVYGFCKKCKILVKLQ